MGFVITNRVSMSAWVRYTGPRDGKGWKNTRTGEVRYQAEAPGEETGPIANDPRGPRSGHIVYEIEHSGAASDLIKSLHDKDDAEDQIATAFNMDTVTADDIKGAREYFRDKTKKHLASRGLTGEFVVHRGDHMERDPDDLVSVTTAKNTARFFAHHLKDQIEKGDPVGQVKTYSVSPESVVFDSSMYHGTFDEAELLVRAGDLRKISEEKTPTKKAAAEALRKVQREKAKISFYESSDEERIAQWGYSGRRLVAVSDREKQSDDAVRVADSTWRNEWADMLIGSLLLAFMETTDIGDLNVYNVHEAKQRSEEIIEAMNKGQRILFEEKYPYAGDFNADKIVIEKLNRLSETIEKGRLAIRVNALALSKILKDGRIKSQFETNSSNGFLNHDMRGIAERRMFSAPIDLPAEKRPIYGYVECGLEDDDVLDTYGAIKIILKDSVRGRTTVSVGDSLDNNLRPHPIGGLASESVNWVELGRYMDRHEIQNYVEAQYHGGISLSDIAEIVFPDTHKRFTFPADVFEKVYSSKAVRDAGILVRYDSDSDSESFLGLIKAKIGSGVPA